MGVVPVVNNTGPGTYRRLKSSHASVLGWPDRGGVQVNRSFPTNAIKDTLFHLSQHDLQAILVVSWKILL